MKDKGLIKELFISIIITACVIFIASIFYYNKIYISKVIPEAEVYHLSAEMQKDLNSVTNNGEEIDEIVTTYYIDAADLKKYEKNNEYKKGKKNPFAVENDSSEVGNNINSIDINESSSYNTFYEDQGIK